MQMDYQDVYDDQSGAGNPDSPPPGYHWVEGVGWVPDAQDDGTGATAEHGHRPPDPAPSPDPGPPAPNLAGGALAPYDVPAPAFPDEPAYVGTQFEAPSVQDALKDPGYQFERDESLNGLQRWAAARGTLNDTGTANALMDVGRNAATQRLGDVWGRAFTGWNANEDARRQAYGINRQTQYIDPWTAKYNAWAQQGNFYLQNQGTVANTALGFAQL